MMSMTTKLKIPSLYNDIPFLTYRIALHIYNVMIDQSIHLFHACYLMTISLFGKVNILDCTL